MATHCTTKKRRSSERCISTGGTCSAACCVLKLSELGTWYARMRFILGNEDKNTETKRNRSKNCEKLENLLNLIQFLLWAVRKIGDRFFGTWRGCIHEVQGGAKVKQAKIFPKLSSTK